MDHKDNLALEISSDPTLVRDFINQTNDPGLAIPVEFDAEFRHFMSAEPRGGQVPTRINGPEDYQVLYSMIQRTQVLLDAVAEKQLLLYGLRHRWKAIHAEAAKYINLRYYNAIETLKSETAKKTVVGNATHKINQGINKLEGLCEQADKAYGHLAGVMFNLKDSAKIVDQYLSTLRYGAGSRREV